MIAWIRTASGTIHAFDMPFFLGGQDVQSLCFKVKAQAKPHFTEKKTRDTTCRACLKAETKIKKTSGDLDL